MRVPAPTSAKIFLLSPARCDGRRASALLNPRAEFPLALQLRSAGGATLGEVFSFLSGLYFRGKLTYARSFSSDAEGNPIGVIRIITTNRGLLTPEERVGPADLQGFACVDLGEVGESFERPLVADAERLSNGAKPVAILLGSIATNKYIGPLTRVFGEQLLFPKEFIGRGDMSRGGLMLRHAADRQELEYIPVATAIRHGKRPPKLAPIKRL